MKRLPVILLALVFLAALLAFAGAITTTTSEKIPFSQVVFISCANGGLGEPVLLEGTLHVVNSVTINGNIMRVKSHFQPMGVSGVGQITGAKYQATGVTQEISVVNQVNGFPSTVTLVNNFRIIGQGPGNNYLVHETFHITVNANGVTTSTVDNFSVECK